MKLTHFKCKSSRKKKVPNFLDKEDFFLACLRTYDVNLRYSVVSYKTKLWLALPSCLPEVPSKEFDASSSLKYSFYS